MTTIVVADDDPAVRDLLRVLLEDAGYIVVDYPNGRGVIEHLKRLSADLLITDIFMPEAEGLETIRRAKTLRPEMPIIAISGGSFRGKNYLYAAEQFGALVILEKPFLRGDLLVVVENVLMAHTT